MSQASSLARLIELPVISDPRGNLCFVESSKHMPFDIARIFYLYDVPSGSMRAGHAHYRLHQLMLPLSGSFDVMLHDGEREERIQLNRPNVGLHIRPMIWRELVNFSAGSVCVVLASTPYDESDYIREFDDFVEQARR